MIENFYYKFKKSEDFENRTPLSSFEFSIDKIVVNTCWNLFSVYKIMIVISKLIFRLKEEMISVINTVIYLYVCRL